MLEVRKLDLDGVYEIQPKKSSDDRGFFSETWNEAEMLHAGFDIRFVQDNHSYSASRGALRGLHFQAPPFAQDKLVRVVRGSVFDVAVDIRRGSPTFGAWVGIELSAKKWNQVLVSKGYAHGFLTLEDDTEVAYKVSAPYSPDHDRAIRFDDPDIAIAWPIPSDRVTLSRKDDAAPRLANTETGFSFP